MPLVKVNMLAGKTPEFKKTLFDCIHQGLIDAFGIADWDRFQRIEEFYDYRTHDFPGKKSRTEKSCNRKNHRPALRKTWNPRDRCFYRDERTTF